MRARRFRVSAVALLLMAAACATGSPAPEQRSPVVASGTSRIPDAGTFDYQLGGASEVPPGARIVVRDASATPAPGVVSICYVNAFQTQPGESEQWLSDHPELVLHVDGAPLEDPDWPDELLLDTSTPEKREAIVQILGEQVGTCADKGFDAVEPDNLDSYTRSHGLLTEADNLALSTLLVQRAHAAGLAIAQKNTVELGGRGKAAGFDLAVAEDCAEYDECGDYTAVYGRQVIEIVYDDAPDFEELLETSCADHGRGDDSIPVVGRDRPLSLPGDPGYTFVTC